MSNLLGNIQPQGFPSLPEDWVSDQSTFLSVDEKVRLCAFWHHPQEWKNPTTLIIFHGLGEHSGRYLHAPHYLKKTVGSVYCFDHRGHGRSEGLRGHADPFDTMVADAAQVVNSVHEQLQRKFPGKETDIHVLGHSMGGLIALRVAHQYPSLPVRSYSISAPLLKIQFPLPQIKHWAALGLSFVWGTLHMSSELDASCLSKDPAVIEAYRQDQLVHSKGTPKFYRELQKVMKETAGWNSGVQQPLLMIVPQKDQVVSSDQALSYFRNLKSRDKLLKTYPDCYHEPFNDTEKDQVFEDVRQWIESHKTKGEKAS